MRVIIEPTEAGAVQATVERLASRIRTCPTSILGLATGGTMDEVYAGLRQAHHAGLSFAGLRSFNLDEYVGLPAGHRNSYHRYMEDQLFRHVDMPRDAACLPDGAAPDPEAEALTYEARIQREGPVHLQLLGLGENGHIGFNEPGSPIDSVTHVTRLSQDTMRANSRYFEPDEMQPDTAITMGISTILGAREILLLATGSRKAAAVAAMLEGPVSPAVPASALRTHANCTIILDAGAATSLTSAHLLAC